MAMRMITLLLALVLMMSWPIAAQQPEPPSAAGSASTKPDEKATSELPVSLDRIRDGLERPAPGRLFVRQFLKELDKMPDFRIDTEGRRKIDELLATLDFKSGPTPAGGIYAFEQQRITTPAVDNPLAQPYAAFNQGQLLTILIENLAGKYLAGRAADAITKSVRERAEATARKDVEDSVSEYCAAKPNNGAGMELCAQQRPESAR
jgi:hypothetical protein